MYFLDTNICIYYLNGTYESIEKHLKKTSPKEIKISAIVKAEVLFGLEKCKKKNLIREKYLRFLAAFEIMAFDDIATEYYAKIRAKLENKGNKIGGNDLLIASTVLAHKGILITKNVKEFKRIPELSIEDWTIL